VFLLYEVFEDIICPITRIALGKLKKDISLKKFSWTFSFLSEAFCYKNFYRKLGLGN
jgi:hypothetical protein